MNKGGEARAKQEKEEARQRKLLYNKNPNLCLYCGELILCREDQKLYDIQRKKFCNKSCAAKMNNKGNIKNLKGKNGKGLLLDDKSDEEIINAFNSSKNCTEFCKKLGYKYTTDSISFKERLESLNLDILDFKNKIKLDSFTKEEIFNNYKNWSSARSAIQKDARITYEKSDRQKSCYVCGYNKCYEVAHIKSVASFSGDSLISEINNINNLIALCPIHHWEYDHNELNIDKYI